MARDVHHVPGRVRFKIPGLRNDETLMRALPRALRAYQGVECVGVWPASNSLIVHYDPRCIDPRQIAEAVNQGPWIKPNDTTATDARSRRPPAGQRHRPIQIDDAVISSVRQMGAVFGRTAFKVALDQAVRGGVNSIVRATVGRS